MAQGAQRCFTQELLCWEVMQTQVQGKISWVQFQFLDMETKLKMLMDVKEVIDLELKAFNFDRLVVNDKKQKVQIELKST